VTCVDAVRLLDAYVDDELGADERARFRAHADACPRCGRAVDRRIELQGAIRSVEYHAAPERLRAAVTAKTRGSRQRIRLALAAAATVLLAAGVGGAIWTTQMRTATGAIAASVVANHVNALQTSRVIDVRSSDQHTVKPWFLGKIDFAPPVADLSAAGFPLLGGRLASIDGRAVAALVYQRRLHPISVFVWPESDVRARMTAVDTVRGFNVRHWTADAMSFWAVTDANPADLQALELAIRRAVSDGH
jgi:anti-sigma factor (TIGR02949 family)